MNISVLGFLLLLATLYVIQSQPNDRKRPKFDDENIARATERIPKNTLRRSILKYFDRRLRNDEDYMLKRWKEFKAKHVTINFEKDYIKSSKTYQQREHYIISGNIKLKTVLSRLQHFVRFSGLAKGQRTYFTVPIGGKNFKFRMYKWTGDQIIIETGGDGHWRGQPYSKILEPLNKMDSKTLANDLLGALETDISKQPKFNVNGDNMREFLLVTNVAEAAAPVDTDSMQSWKNALEKRENINDANSKFPDILKEIKAMGRKTGRTPRMDKFIRKKLKMMKEGKQNFKDYFKTFPVFQTGGAQAGREMTVGSEGSMSVSSDSETSSHILDMMGSMVLSGNEQTAQDPEIVRNDNTHTQQEIIMKQQANEEGQRDVIKRKIDETVGKHNQNSCRKKRKKRSICTLNPDNHDIKIKENSLLYDGDKLEFTVIDSEDSAVQRRFEIEIDTKQLVRENFIEEIATRDANDPSPTRKGSAMTKVSRALGVYGILAGISAANAEFHRGNDLRGAMFLSQSIYMAGGVVGINNFVSKASNKIAYKAMSKVAGKIGFQKSLQKMTQKIAKSLLGRIASNVPVLGLAFDIYFIQEDIKDLVETDFSDPNELLFVPLKIINLGLDLTSTTLSLLGPEMEPFAMAVSIFRMVFSEFYINILTELQKVNWHSPWMPLQAVGAFIIGYYKSIGNILTGGLIRSIENLDQERNNNRKLIQNLQNPENYFSIETGEDVDSINFNGGDFSSLGGGIKFELDDYGTATLSIEGVPQLDGSTKTISSFLHVGRDVQDIILGLGQSRQFTYTKKKAKLWGFIGVKTYKIICGERYNQESLHGTYIGNSYNNKFFALQALKNAKRRKRNFLTYDQEQYFNYSNDSTIILQNTTISHSANSFPARIRSDGVLNSRIKTRKQQAQKGVQSEMSLPQRKAHYGRGFGRARRHREKRECSDNYGKINPNTNFENYFYDIDGGLGNDTFFLGPQTSVVKGNSGADMYILQPRGGIIYIDNFDADEETDVIFLNISFGNVKCERELNNLIITARGSHRVVVKNYYLGEKYQHIIFRSIDGVIFYPNSTETNKVDCIASAIEKLDQNHGETINLRSSIFQNVLSVIGTNHADFIYGNDEDNVIDSGDGGDYMEGGPGMDTYIIRAHKSTRMKTLKINNFDPEKELDQLVIEEPFKMLSAEREDNDLTIIVSLSHSRQKRGVFLFNEMISFLSLLQHFRQGRIAAFRSGPFYKIRIENWFGNEENRHIALISGDHIMFTIELRNEVPFLIPALIDFSTYEKGSTNEGIFLNLEKKEIKNFDFSDIVFSKVATVVDSPYDDTIYGNALSNFISCSGGRDVLSGGEGMDRYFMKEHCQLLTIYNFDENNDTDILFLYHSKDGLHLQYEQNSDTLLLLNKNKRIVQIIDWFKDTRYQHLFLQLTSGDALKLPETKDQLEDIFFHLPLQIELNRDPPCGTDGIYVLDMYNDSQYRYVQRVDFSFGNCTYHVIGNDLDNYIRIGPAGPEKRQYIEGGGGKDIYVVNNGDGDLEINNFANDNETDDVKFNLPLNELIFGECGEADNLHLNIQSKKETDKVNVTILFFCNNSSYRHLLFHTSDGVVLNIDEKDIRVQQIDRSISKFSQVIDLASDERIASTSSFFGAIDEENELYGNDQSNKMVGGKKNDVIFGDDGNDWIEGNFGDDYLVGGTGLDFLLGGNGDDEIYGEEDDDVMFPGDGADIVDGGFGSDTVVFKGDVLGMAGVYVNLEIGFGLDGDAEGDFYVSVENIQGSDFNDTLIGTDDNNAIFGYSGNDILVPGHGNDKLNGGEGVDYYIFSGSKGIKNIDNYSSNLTYDFLVVNDSSVREMCSYRYQGDLHIAFSTSERVLNGFLLTDDNHLHVTLEDWFFGDVYRHIIFQLNDQSLDDTDEYFFDIVNVDEMTNALENFTDIEVSVKKSRLQISWSPFFSENVTRPCNCSLYLAYRQLEDVDFEANQSTIQEVSEKMFDTKYVSSDVQEVNIMYATGNYEIRLVLGKCGRVVSVSPSVYFYEPFNWSIVIVSVVLVFICVSVLVIITVFLFKRRQKMRLRQSTVNRLKKQGAVKVLLKTDESVM